MAKPTVGSIHEVDIGNIVDSAKAVLPVVFNKVEDAPKRDSRMFPNGIDLIKLTLKTGTNYEFSVVIAGKAVPSVEEPVALPEQK